MLNELNEKTRNRRHIMIRDIERCPYAPKDIGYDEWHKRDDERLTELSQARQRLFEKAANYTNHADPVIRDMAYFIRWMLR